MDALPPETPDTRDPPVRASPMMEQYTDIKAAHPDCLLFYRMGDFYELFFQDAEIASQALGIVLTRRGKHLGQDIPMCGVPIHRSDEYLHRLIAQGHRVAICEQTEDPAEARKRGGKSVVRRAVVRLVTPGTITEETLLEARRNSYLAAVCRMRNAEPAFGLAFVDISTGEFGVAERDLPGVAGELARLAPSEVLVPDALFAEPELAPVWRQLLAVTPLTRDVFDAGTAERRLAGYFSVASTESFGALSRTELTAAAACVTYIERTQLGRRPPLSPPMREPSAATLQIDAATRANLELTATLRGDRRGSLLDAVDRTVTVSGSRLLGQRLAAPLTDGGTIRRRLDAVAALVADPALRNDIRAALKACPDVARSLARVALARAGPRDLAVIRDGLGAAGAMSGRLAGDELAADIIDIRARLRAVDPGLTAALAAALSDDLPHHRRDGGFIRPGFSIELDELRALRDETRRVIASLQARYIEETGIRTLKVRHNNMLGYFIETPSQHADKMLADVHGGQFVQRQSMAGQVRFSTAALAELEAKISTAAERALALESDLFDELAGRVVAAAEPIKAAAHAVAELDVASALAHLAATERYARPEIVTGHDFIIEGGRHPVVEQALGAESRPFVANGCDLSPSHDGAGRICLLTGPNMAGKSTFLRQNAVAVVLAQAGSFVPATRARIGIVDRLFSRVGAADDLARGRSTFMVEMVETAAILNQATERSLVILDEIGRGTATFDGLSIAWGVVEHLHAANRCRALFATHYHELTALAARLPRLFNATMKVKEWNGDVVFLHEVVTGAADRSYGIQVAKLAGLPRGVIKRAQHVLSQLEAEDRASPVRVLDDLPLFAAARPSFPAPESARLDALLAAIAALDPDDMSPRDALQALYALRAKAADLKR